MNKLASKAISQSVVGICNVLANLARPYPSRLRALKPKSSWANISSIALAAILLAACGDDSGLNLGDDANLDTTGLFTYEEAQPVVTISGPSFANANVSSTFLQYKILIDKAVANELSASDSDSISISNGSIAALSKIDAVDLDEYLLYLQPDPLATDGDINITIMAGAVVARVGDADFPNEAVSFIVEYDNTAPSVDITVDTAMGNAFLEESGLEDVNSDDYYIVNGDFSVLLGFDEEVTGLTESDISLSLAGVAVTDAVALDGGFNYRVDFELDDSNTLDDNIDIEFALVAGAVEDSSGARVEAELRELNISNNAEIGGYGNARTEYLVTLDRSPPIGTVASSPSAVDYMRTADFDLENLALTESIVPLKAGDKLEFVIEFEESIEVSGTPYIPFGIDSLFDASNSVELEKKAWFAFVGDSSQGIENAAATFVYTIESNSDLLDVDGINASLNAEIPQLIFTNGAYISDKYQNQITEDITLSPAFSLSDINVDTITPEVVDITWASEGHIYNSESESGKFSVDEIITFNLSFTEVIYPNSLSESVADYSFTIDLKSGDQVTSVAIPGASHIVERDISIFQFEFAIEEGYNAADGISYVSFSGPEDLFGDKAGNAISQSLETLVSRTEEEINIFIDADLPKLLSITEISEPAASSVTDADNGSHYYVGANYKTDDAEIIVLRVGFTEEVNISKIDDSMDSAVSIVAYFKDDSSAVSVDNTYSFVYTGAYDELNSTLLFEYEVVPFGEVGVTSDDLDGIELDYLLLENASIRDSFGNSMTLDSSDDINFIYRASVSTGAVNLDFLDGINIETTPAEVTGISFTGVNNGEDMLSILGEGTSVEVVLTFSGPVAFYYNLEDGGLSRPSLAMEIVEGTEPELAGANIVYAHHAAPDVGDINQTHTFTYTIQPEDANGTLSSIWLLRNSTLADNGGYDDLMIVPDSSAYDLRSRNVQEGFSSSAIDDYIFSDNYARHPLIPIETGTEPIAYFHRPAGYDSSADVNSYLIYPLTSSAGVSFTLAYGADEDSVTHVQVLNLNNGNESPELPYLLLHGDLKDDTDADGDGIADNSERWQARAYLSLIASGLQSAVDSTYSDLVFILSESEDPADEFAAQYISAESSIGLIYDSLVVGDDYSISTLSGNPVQTDISNYTYDNDPSATLSTARERVFYDPYPRVLSVVELITEETGDDDKNYNLDEVIKVSLTVSEDVLVSGAGSISLYLLGYVTDQSLDGTYSDTTIALDYISSESNERELVFAYQVESDKYADGVGLKNGTSRGFIETTGEATIKDLSVAGRELRGLSEELDVTYIGSTVSSIDSRAPRIDSISMSRRYPTSNTAFSTEPIEGNETVTFTAGDQLILTLGFYSESVIGDDELTSIFGNPYVDAFGSDGGDGPRLQLEIDPGEGYTGTDTTRYATYSTHVTGTASPAAARANYYIQHIFTYDITSDDHDISGIKIIGPLDSSLGNFQNIPDVPDGFDPAVDDADQLDKNEANYSLRGALVNLGMEANSTAEEYELDYAIVDNFPTLVGFHIDTPETSEHTTADLRFSPTDFGIIQFYAVINQEDLDESSLEDSSALSATLPFSIYDSTAVTAVDEGNAIADFAAQYAGWAHSVLGSTNYISIDGIDDNYPVSSSNYSVLLFTFDLAGSAAAKTVNADTIIIPENPFQNQTFNPKNPGGKSVNLIFDETNITNVSISEVDQLIVDFRPPEITAIDLPAEGLYYYSDDPGSTMSSLTYKVTFSEPVYADNLDQHDKGGTPRLYQSIGSAGVKTWAICASDHCLNPTGTIFSMDDDIVEFHYTIGAGDSGYVSGFYVTGGPDTDANNGSTNIITDAYGSNLNGDDLTIFTMPAYSTDGRSLSDPSSINLVVDNADLAIEAVTLPESAVYQAGDEINITVEFNREVDLKDSVNSFPQISFLVGSQESGYSDGNASATFSAPFHQRSNILTFTYEVQSSLDLDDYDGIQLSPAAIDWNGADIQDALRSTEDINTSAPEVTDLISFIGNDVVDGVYIDVVYPELEVTALQLAPNQANAADSFDENDYHYYLSSNLVFNLSFNEPVVIPSSTAGEYQSFIKFTYEDSYEVEYERTVRFDPDSASSTLAQYGQIWNYDSGSSADIYFVYEVSTEDATSASNADGFIADGYLRLRDINLSGIVDRSGKQLLLNSQLSISPATAAIDLDKTSIYSYNLFAIDESNNTFDLYSSDVTAGAAGLLTEERYITSGQDLVIEFSFRHHPSEDPSRVIFDIIGSASRYIDVDINNDTQTDFDAYLQEDSSGDNNYSNGTSTLRYLLELSSYTDDTSATLSDLDGIDISFDANEEQFYLDQSGQVNLAFADVFLSSLELINVDTQGPSIDEVYMQPSDTGLTLYYGPQDELQITVQFSEPITMSTGTFNDIDLNFSLRNVDTDVIEPRVAHYLSDDGNRSYIFTYLIDDGTNDADFDQIYFDSVEIVHAPQGGVPAVDITTIIGDTRDNPNLLTSATKNYTATSAAVQGHAIDFANPSIASLIIPPGDVSSKTIELGGGDSLTLTMVTTREVAFASDSAPRLRLFADSTPVTFHYAGDYNASAFALSHTFTYAVGNSVETNSTGLYLPTDALLTNNAGGFDVANNPLNRDLNISAGSTQVNTRGTAWSSNPTEYILIDSRIPEFTDKYIPPQSLFLQYSNPSISIEFNASHVFVLDTVNGSNFLDEFGGGFITGDDSVATKVDFTRPVYQANIDGTRWNIWSSVTDGYYRISTDSAYEPWFFSKSSDVASIQDVFIPGTVTEFGELSSADNPWYLVADVNTTDFDAANYTTAEEINATLNQRYLYGETLHTYLVLSEQVQVAGAYSAESSYGNYPAYSLTYTNSYDGSNTAADLPLSFSHWLETVSDTDSEAAKQVMVYANTLNSTTTNRVGTAVQPARQLPDGAQLAIEDLFGNVLPLSDDGSSLNIYQEAENNNIAGVELSGYLVQLESVGLYQLVATEPDQVSAIDPDLTYIIGDQLVLDLTFNAELQETTYDPVKDFFLELVINNSNSASKQHILGNRASIAGDIDQRYWYNSTAGAYDDNDGDGNTSRADYEANIDNTSTGFNNVLRYIFTIPEDTDNTSFNTLEEGVTDPSLTITDLNFSTGLVDSYGSRVDTSAVVAALSEVVLPVNIDSIRPQIQLSGNGIDYITIAEFNTYSRDDYFKYLNGNISQHPEIITFTLSFTEPIVMPAQSDAVQSGESNFTSGLRFQVDELNSSIGERIAHSAYVPYIGTGSAPEYTTTIFTYAVDSADDSVISTMDINATIYDLAGNPNYYSFPETNITIGTTEYTTLNSGFAGTLYSGIDLDGLGPRANIPTANDIVIQALQPGGTTLVSNAKSGTYGVGTTLYFYVKYDQTIYINNYSGAASDIRLALQSTSGGSEVSASIIDSQVNSFIESNKFLTFTYTLSAADDSNDSGYLVRSLHYDDSGFARYGILDSYGNGINDGDGNLSHEFADLNITTGAIDTVMPYVTGVSILDANGSEAVNNLYGNDDTITFALTFSEQVSTNQSNFYKSEHGLRFKIDSLIGDDAYRIASYSSSQSGEQTFTFTYVVGSVADENDKGDVYLNDITLLGDTYDLALNLETELSYSGPGGADNDSGHDVDSGAPIITALSIEYQEPDDLYEAIQEDATYTLGIGTTLRFSLTFDEAISFDVNSTGAAVPYLELKAVNLASSTPQRIHAHLTEESNATIGDGFASSLAFSFVIGSGAGDNNLSSDNNATQQSLYNYLEVFALANADQIQDSATNVLSSSADYALTGDAFDTIHSNGVDSEPDIFGDTLINIDSVRPQITLLELDKTSSETYGAGEDISLTISFSEALNESALDSGASLTQVAMRLERTQPNFVDANRSIFAYTFSKYSSNTISSGTSVEYLLTGTSPGTVFDVNSSGYFTGTSSSAGNFFNFAYEGEITGDYTLTGDIRDLGGNYIDPADLTISTNGSTPSPSSLTEISPTAFVDHLAPRPLATTVRLSGTSNPSSYSNPPYKLGDVFVFTVTFHEDLSLLNHDNDLGNLQLDLDFDVESIDRSIPLGTIPSGNPSELYFTYTVSDGDQALENNQSLSLFGFSKASGYDTLAIVDAHGNQVDPESIDFTAYDLDGNGSVFDSNGNGEVDPGDEQFDILQPDFDLLIDGVAPYWVSISSSSSYIDTSTSTSSEVNRSRPYALSNGETITFTLTASEDLYPINDMQLLLYLQPENSSLGAQQTRSINGLFVGSTPSSVITFTYTVGSGTNSLDKAGDGIDHLALMASSSYQNANHITRDLASNPIPEHDFSLIDGFIVFPEDETLASNQVKFDTTPPIVESVTISGFDATGLAITNTRISFTLQFQDDDLDTISIDNNRSEINLTILDLSTDYNPNSSTDAALTLHQINADSLVFAGALPERIDWSGTLSLEIADANSLITDKSDPANGMVSGTILGSGVDDLIETYTIDTAPPRIANLHEIESTLYTPIATSGIGYGPGRQATFMVTFNEELASIGGSQSSTAKLQFFIYDDNATAGGHALRLRTAAASGGSAELKTDRRRRWQ